jgi:hypothetical protein
VVEMRNGGDVPAVTGQGACEETACVVGEMDDDQSDYFLGKSGGDGRGRRGSPQRNAAGKGPPDSSETPVPNPLDE